MEDPENNYISVCERRCEVDLSLSDSWNTVCHLSPYATKYSTIEFDIAISGPIEFLKDWVGTGTNPTVLNDGDLMTNYDDDTSPHCTVEIVAETDYILGVKQVKVYMPDPVDRRLYNGLLEIYGSDDGGTSYDLLYTFD